MLILLLQEKYTDFDFDNRLHIRATATIKMIAAREAAMATTASNKQKTRVHGFSPTQNR